MFPVGSFQLRIFCNHTIHLRDEIFSYYSVGFSQLQKSSHKDCRHQNVLSPSCLSCIFISVQSDRGSSKGH